MSSKVKESPVDARKSLNDTNSALLDSQGRQKREESSKSPNGFTTTKKVGMG